METRVLKGRGKPTNSSGTLLITEPEQVKEKMREMVSSAEREILLLLPAAAAFHREEGIGVIDLIETAAASRRVEVLILCPVDPGILERIYTLNERFRREGARPLELMSIPEARSMGTVTILVTDQRESLVVEQREPLESKFERAIGLATYSVSEPSVRANVRFIERMREVVAMAMREEALLLAETRSRRQAELLQDILTHDIRNFNQISLTSAEALREEVGPDDAPLVENIIRATEASSALIESAKTLSRIVSSERVPLVAVHLEESIRRSLAVVGKTRPDKSIVLKTSLRGKTMVLADSLLDEVFTNVISNSVKYTPGKEVPLEIQIGEPAGPSGQNDAERKEFVRVSIVDRGQGIPDSMKEKVFNRYQETKSGSGLGLSIVRALVVDQYRGRIRVTDRVPNDYRKGVNLEIWLQTAA